MVREGVGPACFQPTLPPAGGGPVPCGHWLAARTSARAGWLGDLVLPTRLPTRYTHPGTAPGPLHGPSDMLVPGTNTVYGHPRTCTYDRFWSTVGEPRGLEHTPVSGSRTGYIQLLRFARPFDWVSAKNILSFTEFSTCFTEFVPSLTEFSTCFTDFSTRFTEFRTRLTTRTPY